MSGVQTKETQAALSPADALAALAGGNARFAEGRGSGHPSLDQVRATAHGQFPMAAVVGCIDSRVPPEVVFDLGIGDIFVARTAGNVIGDDVLGSLEFAAAVAGVKAIVVLGHSQCGAVKGACDGVELGHLSGLLAKISPAVREASGGDERPGSDDAALVERAVEANTRRAMTAISDASPILRERIAGGELALASAIYDLESGTIAWLD